jgi:SAM-dependent methyltransferase
MYSNSRHDRTASQQASTADETAVRRMYEHAPYPGLGAGLKNLNLYIDPIAGDLKCREQVRFLDAGCGTGHVLIGVAKQYPDWECCGIDISQASLDVAAELAKLHGATVTMKQGSYIETLPFEGKFDVIAAMGTIHHAANPVAAMRNLREYLKDDGYLLVHLYGLRLDQAKFDMKEILDIFEPDLTNIDRRFFFYDALMRHRRRHWLRQFMQLSLIDLFIAFRVWFRNLLRRSRGIVWSPPFTDRFTEPTAPWIDHFCHPCERAYEVPDIVALLRDSGFEVYRMLGQGREYSQLLPPEWLAFYDRLPVEAKWRISELLAFRGGSFRMILRKTQILESA